MGIFTECERCDELKDEIKRLRREHEKAWADAQLKAAEIERLRGLLLNASLAELRIEGMKRVREALGE